jgi:hypothetical protein
VLEELQISVVMLALKYSQAKRAAFFRNREEIVRPFRGMPRTVRIQQQERPRSAQKSKGGKILE